MANGVIDPWGGFERMVDRNIQTGQAKQQLGLRKEGLKLEERRVNIQEDLAKQGQTRLDMEMEVAKGKAGMADFIGQYVNGGEEGRQKLAPKAPAAVTPSIDGPSLTLNNTQDAAERPGLAVIPSLKPPTYLGVLGLTDDGAGNKVPSREAIKPQGAIGPARDRAIQAARTYAAANGHSSEWVAETIEKLEGLREAAIANYVKMSEYGMNNEARLTIAPWAEASGIDPNDIIYDTSPNADYSVATIPDGDFKYQVTYDRNQKNEAGNFKEVSRVRVGYSDQFVRQSNAFTQAQQQAVNEATSFNSRLVTLLAKDKQITLQGAASIFNVGASPESLKDLRESEIRQLIYNKIDSLSRQMAVSTGPNGAPRYRRLTEGEGGKSVLTAINRMNEILTNAGMQPLINTGNPVPPASSGVDPINTDASGGTPGKR